MAAPSDSTRARAERRARRARRRRLRPARLLWVRHRNPRHRRSGGRRDPPDQLPHHGAVFPDPGLPPDRAQSPPQRHGAGGRPGDGVSGLLGPPAAGERLHLRDPPGQRLRHLRRGEVAPQPRGGDEHGRLPGDLAPRPRLRPVVRIPRWRDPSVRAGSLPRQPLRAAAPVDRGGLSPECRPGRPGHRVPGRSSGGRRHSALLPVLRHGRLPLAPPCTGRLDRQVQGSLRPGLGPVARRDVRPPGRLRRRARGHGPVAAAGLGPELGLAGRPGAGTGRTLHGVLCRLPLLHGPPDRAGARLHRRPRRRQTTQW